VRFINRAGERLLRPGDTLGVLLGRLRAGSSEATARLHALIARAACPDRELRAGGSMGVTALGRRQPLAVTVAPIRAHHASRFETGHSVIVCVTDLEAGVRLPGDRLRALFGLTPAETRLALAMFEGANLADAAEAFGVSLNTVRNQLARLFEKTGTTRQSELMSLMMRTVGFDLA
jgi:DNA-binding CsgD family transcriptional regulator